MIYINQLHPIKFGIEKNKQFLKELHKTEELVDVSMWFDKRENSIARMPDRDMSLEKFIDLMDENAMISLQFAYPDPKSIRYCIRQPDRPASRFAWVDCPYNEHNFNIFSQLYEQIFKKKIEEEPVLEGIDDFIKKNYYLYKQTTDD
jgi:hypothetical protein